MIFGSAPMLASGLRADVGDLDIVARGAAWERAASLGKPMTGSVSGQPMVHFESSGSRIEISRYWVSHEWDSDVLIDDASVVDGLRFARLADVLAYKRELNRPKDLPDIELLERRLAVPAHDR